MFYLPAFTFSSGYSLGFGFLAGLRLLVLRQFQTFFASIAPPPWRTAFSRFPPVVNSEVSVFASVANCAVKPTRLRRAAYFRSLVPVNLTLQSSWFFHRPSPSHAFIRWVFGRVSGFACNHFASFKSFLPPAHASQARAAIGLVALCIHAPFHRRG